MCCRECDLDMYDNSEIVSFWLIIYDMIDTCLKTFPYIYVQIMVVTSRCLNNIEIAILFSKLSPFRNTIE